MSQGGGPNGPAGPPDFSKTTFLVADDKAFFRDMVHTAVMRAGARDVKHAVNIETAIELLNRLGQLINCVICDWDIAPIGGLDLLRMIRCRTLPKTDARTPVVILTGKANAAAVKAAMALDVNGFAVAPLSFEKLVKTVANAMARTWSLQIPSVYGAVPAVAPTLVVPQGTKVSGKDIILRGHDAADAAHAPSSGVAAAGDKPLPRRSAELKELKNVHMCILSEVRPGAILARDLHDRSGHLLLKTGTELKPSLINRLRDVAQGHDESYHVWIGERSA